MTSTLEWDDASDRLLSNEGSSGSVAGFVGSPNTSVLLSDDPSLFEYLRQEPQAPPNPFSSHLQQQYVPAFPEVTSRVGSGAAPRVREGGRFYDIELESDGYDFAVSGLPLLRGLIIAVLVGALVLTIAYVRGMVWSSALDNEGSTQPMAHLPASADEVEVVNAPLLKGEAAMTAATKGRHRAFLVNFSRTTAKSE